MYRYTLPEGIVISDEPHAKALSNDLQPPGREKAFGMSYVVQLMPYHIRMQYVMFAHMPWYKIVHTVLHIC